MLLGVGLGAMDSLLSFATLLNCAHILTSLLPDKTATDHPNVLFVLFNGESYDYIGSQRFVYDLNNGAFPPKSQYSHPIDPKNIELMIDIGALDNFNTISVYQSREFNMVSF